jgi:hypothetical protein
MVGFAATIHSFSPSGFFFSSFWLFVQSSFSQSYIVKYQLSIVAHRTHLILALNHDRMWCDGAISRQTGTVCRFKAQLAKVEVCILLAFSSDKS